MSLIEILPASLDHAAVLAPHLREADIAELRATTVLSSLAALEVSLALSPLAWTGLVDGRPVCLFGVSASCLAAGIGSPWMLGSDEVEHHQRAFLRRNRTYVAQMLTLFPRLENHVDARNRASIAWLRWLGFSIGPAEPFGRAQLPFHPFSMRRT